MHTRHDADAASWRPQSRNPGPMKGAGASLRIEPIGAMTNFDESVVVAVASIRRRIQCVPSIGLVLGSGLGDFAESLPRSTTISTADIPSYPVGTVAGHRGRLIFSRTANGSVVVAFQGRIHFYESDNPAAVLFPIVVAHELGVRTLIITNAAGGINREFRPGDLMVIRDQINLTAEAPLLRKVNRPSQEMSLYDPGLVHLTLTTARELSLPIQCGIYAGVKGPSYETAAEVEMIHRLGGDAVGMSTVHEVRQAANLGMKIAGISCITNKATGIGSRPLDHSEVTEVAAQVRERFRQLLSHILGAL